MYIYIAGPYSKGDVVLNVCEAVQVGDALLSLGHTPFIPHMTYTWHMVIPHDIDYWYEYDMEWLKKCDAVYRIKGASVGADLEVQKALELGLPVFYNFSDLFRHFSENK